MPNDIFELLDGTQGHTKAPWVPTRFTRPDGSPIETVAHVAETTACSAGHSERAELHGVTLTGDDDGVVVCYTGNGPKSEANARLIAKASELAAAVEKMMPVVEALKHFQSYGCPFCSGDCRVRPR